MIVFSGVVFSNVVFSSVSKLLEAHPLEDEPRCQKTARQIKATVGKLKLPQTQLKNFPIRIFQHALRFFSHFLSLG
jgi:hypothetical protein